MKLTAQEFRDDATEGMIISIPQYESNLEVTFVGEFFVGVQFADPSKRNDTQKRLVFNNSNTSVYLQAGTTDKGQVEYIKDKS